MDDIAAGLKTSLVLKQVMLRLINSSTQAKQKHIFHGPARRLPCPLAQKRWFAADRCRVHTVEGCRIAAGPEFD
jgi:hypothetical protein